jgi:hypothetical protein
VNHRVLTPEQIEEAKRLKDQGYSKRKLAKIFEVGITTIYENCFATERRDRREYLKVYFKNHPQKKRVCIPCPVCEICLTKDITGPSIPNGYQVGDVCIACYLRRRGLTFGDLMEIE